MNASGAIFFGWRRSVIESHHITTFHLGRLIGRRKGGLGGLAGEAGRTKPRPMLCQVLSPGHQGDISLFARTEAIEL
jgi:hypothetical protein